MFGDTPPTASATSKLTNAPKLIRIAIHPKFAPTVPIMGTIGFRIIDALGFKSGG